jgi:hypothetical protein
MKLSRAPAITSYFAALVVVMISSGTPNAAQISVHENFRFARNCKSLLASFGVTTSAPAHNSTGRSAMPTRRFRSRSAASSCSRCSGSSCSAVRITVPASPLFSMMPFMNSEAAWSVPAAVAATASGDIPRQKSNGFGSFSCHTSSGRNTWLDSGLFRL